MSDATPAPVPVRGIILSHGSLADGYVDAVRRITGLDENVLIPLSNSGLSPEVMADRLVALAGAGPTIVFTDLPAGSCGFTARRLCQRSETLAVISGVNLAVLLEFVMHRNDPLPRLVPFLVEKGRGAIMSAPSRFEGVEGNAHRAASG